MKIQVVGAGGWGLALTRLLALNGHRVLLWCREEDHPEALRETRQSPIYLPGVLLPDTVEVVRDVESDVEMAVWAVPSHAMRLMVDRYRFSPETIMVSVAKGIENGSLLRMSQVIEEVIPGATVVAFSGPSHAEEVGRDLPATVVAAGKDLNASECVQQAFMSANFRVYTTSDIVGVEFGGSLKNVIAIATGVCDGLGLGDNAKAAVMTRGMAEMARLGVAHGANPLTFAGLSGMGDLITTCCSRHSRNRAVGEHIAEGWTLERIQNATPMVAEGIRTAQSARDLARRDNIEMPIAEQVWRLLFENANPRDAVAELMRRDAKPERG